MASKDLLNEIVAIRHDLHQHPELGYEEHRTSQLIADFLDKCQDIEITKDIAETGVVGVIDSGQPGPVIALRADIDALPIIEKTGLPYASSTTGRMHACGHDGHTAALLGAAQILSSEQRPSRGKVVLLFQPAEEGRAGAKKVMESGVLQKLGVEEIYGFHGWPGEKAHTVCLMPQEFMASSNSFDISVIGKGTHGSMPHLGADPLTTAAHIVIALQSICSRVMDPRTAQVVSIGALHGGTASNVIPDSASIVGTFRAFSEEVRTSLEDKINDVATSIARLYGCTAETKISKGYPPLANTPELAEHIAQVAKKVEAVDSVAFPYKVVLGAEDFSFYLKELKGSYWFLGLGTDIPLHSPYFDFNDEILPTAIAMHCAIVKSRCGHTSC